MKHIKHCSILFIFLFFLDFNIHAEVPSQYEVEYSEAVLAYNAKDFKKSLHILEELEKKAPEIAEVLELQVLSHKALQDEKQVEADYAKIIKLKIKQNRPEKEFAPYHFELGLMRHKENKKELATKHFQFALKNNFNESVCHLYLGLYAFQSGAWANSEYHFDGIISSGAEGLKPVAYFYLGQTHGKTAYPSGITQNFISAKKAAKTILGDPSQSDDTKKIAKQIYEATTKVLEPFDHGQFFGNLGVTAGYDSNVLTIPNATSEASGKTSATNTLLIGMGYASSPMQTFQYVPSYRGTFNFNYNRDSRSAEYPTNAFSLFLNINPLSRFSYGTKLDASVIFQNTSTSESSRFKYNIYQTATTIGPYFRYEMKPKFLVGLEINFQNKKYKNDGSGPQERSGGLIMSKMYFKNDFGNRFFNPSAAIKLDSDQAKGADYKATTTGLEFNNQMHISDKLILSETATYAFAKYSQRSAGVRNDHMLVFEVAGSYRLTQKWMFLANLQLTDNISNISDNFYHRLAFSTGATYSF